MSLLGRRIVFELFLEDDDRVGEVFDCFVVATQHGFGVGLAEVVLDHVVIAELQSLPNILETGLVLLQFVVDC